MSDRETETPMLEETGKVVAIEGCYAVIETRQRSACGHCGVGDSCGTSVLAGLFSRRRNQVRLENHLKLSVGDRAVIGINESVLVSTAVMAYLLPLLMMITLAVISSLSGFGDGINFLVGMLGLIGGMTIINRIMGDKDYQAREIVLLRSANQSIIRFTENRSIKYKGYIP